MLITSATIKLSGQRLSRIFNYHSPIDMRNYHIQNRNLYQEKGVWPTRNTLVKQQLSTWGYICPFTIQHSRPPATIGNENMWNSFGKRHWLSICWGSMSWGRWECGWSRENATEITLLRFRERGKHSTNLY